MIKRAAIVAHRWLGVAFCLLFFTWFLSGIGMMYWDYPAVTAADRLARSPVLDPSRIVVAPEAAFASLGESEPVTSVRLNTFDGRPSRVQAYLGPIPHWIYFTPLRKHGPQWSTFVIWSSGLATVSAVLGLAVATWIYSPSKRYRRRGVPTSIPYAGQRRWHLIFGLIFGVAAATWAFSGMLSMEPFPLRTSSEDTGEPVGALLARALRGPIRLDAFSPERQHQALAQLATRSVKELEFASVAGDLVFVAVMDGGDTRLVPLDGSPRTELGRQNLADILAATASTSGGVDVSVLGQYDAYYEDRRRQRPLPVLLVHRHWTAGAISTASPACCTRCWRGTRHSLGPRPRASSPSISRRWPRRSPSSGPGCLQRSPKCSCGHSRRSRPNDTIQRRGSPKRSCFQAAGRRRGDRAGRPLWWRW